MATFFAMPKLGLNMTEGLIVRWLVSEGDEIKSGDSILEIETDKATQEVEAPETGVLGKIVKAEGENIPCNTVIAVILDLGEQMPGEIPVEVAEGMAPKSELETSGEKPAATAQAEKAGAGSDRRVGISPAAKKMAKELGVDISKITPRGSRIKREDVQAAYDAMQVSAAPAAPAAAAENKPMSSVRRRIAEHMDHSSRTTARAALTVEADTNALVAFRELKKAGGSKYSYNVLLASIVGQALREYPSMNARLDGDHIVELPNINVGIAVDAERGLIVPVLSDTDRKGIDTLQSEFAEKSERALQGKSKVTDLEGGTFTITNLGGLEVESFLPVINTPECGILGVGAMVKKPVVVGEQVEIRSRMKLTLAFDHRLVDGAPAARFLQRVRHLIENPPFEK
jgi:pyruvate dehydrogenase E2 component (dihydrolipoamide acetyltransferase)